MHQRKQQGVLWHDLIIMLREAEQSADVGWSLDVDLGMDVQLDAYK